MVDDPNFMTGSRGIPSFFNARVHRSEKATAPPRQIIQGITNHSHGDNSRVVRSLRKPDGNRRKGARGDIAPRTGSLTVHCARQLSAFSAVQTSRPVKIGSSGILASVAMSLRMNMDL